MTLKRLLAPVLFVMLVAMLALAARPAMAQQGPVAAPTGAPADTGALAPPTAAPTTNVDIGGLAGVNNSAAGGFSIVESFLRADVIVKTVMVLLLLASLWSWAIIINKWIVLGRLKRKAARFEKIFWSGQSLDELYQQFAAHNDHPLAAMFVAALREWRRAFEGGTPKESQIPGIKERIDSAMTVTIMRETDGIERQLGFLATVGSVAPFIGLFGTVWGIMNAFIGISESQTTNLAVVAPGIAEALLATALGLVAAIPAVMIYNHLARVIAGYRTLLGDASAQLLLMVSRGQRRRAASVQHAAE